MSILDLIYFLAVCYVCAEMVSIRNRRVWAVRKAFIKDEYLWQSGAYDHLPSYDAMLFNPMYWFKWTFAQWRTHALSKMQLSITNESN